MRFTLHNVNEHPQRSTSWGDLQEMAARLPLGTGFRFEMLRSEEIPALVDCLGQWYPDIRIGSMSTLLQPSHLAQRACTSEHPNRDLLVIVLKYETALAGLFTCRRDWRTMSIHAALGVTAPQYRGANLVRSGLALTEASGRYMGMGFAYGMATLKHPFSQRGIERAGWQLIGITPGFDRDEVRPGVVKRVFEAVYARVLAPRASLLCPDPKQMTERTRRLFERLFPATQRMPIALEG